jgi:DNA-directed RNA polymerase
MTYPYSSEVFGFREQIQGDIMAPLARAALRGQPHPFGDENGGWRAALLLAKVIWQALGAVVTKAGEGMTWLKDVASLMAKYQKPVEWRSPSGFHVIHSYREPSTKQLNLVLGGASVRLVAAERGNHRSKLLRHKQRNGIAPNLIHSQDAAHLHLTVNAMVDKGVSDLAMIHDSFGTQPGNVELLSSTLRETFVEMYERHCPFEEVRSRCLGALPEDLHGLLPPVPTRGTLDIKQVLESPYVFC